MTMLDNMNSIVDKMPQNSNFALLKIAFDKSSPNVTQELQDLYKVNISNHNDEMYKNPFPNSGFDVMFLSDVQFKTPFSSVLVDLGFKTEMFYYDSSKSKYENCAYHLVPRSSITKTPLMQSNHVGIIDSGYRGNLKVPLRYFPEHDNPEYNFSYAKPYTVESKTKLVQICHPTLCPIYVWVVEENELSDTTRGAGGFGSTGV